jgi:hypothetical protein
VQIERNGEQDVQQLGAYICTWKGKPFQVGSGFTQEQRESFWTTPLPNQILISHMAVGRVDVPRHPTFLEIIE